MTATPTMPPATPASPPHDETSQARNRRLSPGTRDRLSLGGLLLATAVLYLWSLGESGWGNSFYAAAAQAGSESWKALFFGASDAAASITVDKTPLSIWVMALSVKLFGLSSWSLLVPQALIGVGTVAVLHASVRRSTGSAVAALLAGATLALTPVAVLMFRFNNPDALLVLLLVGAAAAALRAVESTERHPVRWLLLAGVLVGCGFMTKMLQAFLVLPAFGLVYLLAAHATLPKRVAHLAAAFGAMVVAGGWWVALVELWPAASRPYIGGSQTNSVLELTLGYNGLGRLTGEETGSVGGGNGWGDTGLLRLFDGEIGGQITWLLPAALVLLVAGLVASRRAPRTDRTRAALVVWGGWLVVTALTFSLMAGIFHAYYTVALAPAVAAIVAIGAHQLWRRRHHWAAVSTLAATLAVTGVWSFVLLTRADGFFPGLRWVVLLVSLGAAGALAVGILVPAALRGRLAAAIAVAALASVAAGPAAYALDTVATPHTGSIPSAGPSTGTGVGSPGGRGGRPSRGAFGATPPGITGTPQQGTTGTSPQGGMPTGGPGGATGPGGAGAAGGAGGGMGGLLNSTAPSEELTALLLEDADSYTWIAATVGANNAAGYQLATEQSVMPVGGFNGTDPSPTLEEFQDHVTQGEIHYFLAGGDGRGAGGPGGETSNEIAAWVQQNFEATSVDGVTVYDLTGGAA